MANGWLTWGHLIGTLGHDLTSFALGINNANTVVGVSGNGGMLDPNGSATVMVTDSQGFVYDSTHGLQGITGFSILLRVPGPVEC